MATNITNAQIVQILKLRGYNVPDDFNTAGAQNNEFRNRVIDLLQPTLSAGKFASDMWDGFKNDARSMADASAQGPTGQLIAALKIQGVSPHDINTITLKADQMSKSQGIKLGPNDTYPTDIYSAAVSDTLGADSPIVQHSFSTLNIPTPTTTSLPFGSAGSQQGGTSPAQGTATPGMADALGGGEVPAYKPGQSGAIPGGVPGAPAAPTTPVTPSPVGSAAAKAAAAGTAGAAGAAGKADTSTLAKPMSPAEAETIVKQKYGFMGALLDNPDIHKVMLGIADGSIAPANFQNALMGTNWYQTHNDAQHAWLTLDATDHTEALKQTTDKVAGLKQMAGSWGLTLSDADAQEMATQGLTGGWSDQDYRNGIASHYVYATGTTPLTGVTNQIKGIAANYLVGMDDQSMTKWGQQLITGDKTTDDFTDYARQMASAAHPGLGAWLNADPTRDVKQFLAPYASTASNVLETPANQIDFNNPKYANVFGKLDPKTGEQQILTGPEWESYLRTLPEWQQTDNAHQAVGQLTDKLIQDLGVR